MVLLCTTVVISDLIFSQWSIIILITLFKALFIGAIFLSIIASIPIKISLFSTKVQKSLFDNHFIIKSLPVLFIGTEAKYKKLGGGTEREKQQQAIRINN
jgi:hypothetical protein